MKAILLIHGFLTDYRDFDNLVPRLKEQYDYIHLLVIPGHKGLDSDVIDYNRFTFDETFKLIRATMEYLLSKYDIVDVIGFSMGGALATYLANKYDFNKLVLLAPANKFFNFSLPINRLSYFVRTVIERMNSKRLTKDEIKVIDQELGNVRIDDVKSLQIAFHRLIPNYNIHTLTTFIRIINECNININEIKNPTLLIWGELDQLVPKKSVNELYQKITNENKKIIIYKDISHLMLNSKNSLKIIEEILVFLKN